MHNIIVTKCILKCFEMRLGLQVNFHKSNIDGIGIDRSEIVRFLKVLNCKIMKILFKYPGTQVGGNPRKFVF